MGWKGKVSLTTDSSHCRKYEIPLKVTNSDKSRIFILVGLYFLASS